MEEVMPRCSDKLVPWLIEIKDGGRFVVWSESGMTSENKATSRFRKLTKGRFKKKVDVSSAHPLICSANCWTTASELLADEELKGIESAWWVVGDVEKKPGGEISVATVCPMCEKHARRFRRSLSDRILRIEERLDDFDRREEES
jgi:hypothetical protein